MRKYGVFKVWSIKIGSFLAFLAILNSFLKISQVKKLKIPKIFRLLWTKIFGHPQQSQKWVIQL